MLPKFEGEFKTEYKKLNKAQQEAVDSIDGPVMVVAGPGTGKTQVLALRIGNILQKTDTKADSILCLTFTNSGVKAMKERLRRYIGAESARVHVATFHSFGMDMLDKYFTVLGLEAKPELLDSKDTIILCDEILQNNSWEHIRPRADASRYFRDLKSLISLLKRERITAKDFENKINEEIENIKNNPESISTRGASKGELKKDAEKKIDSLLRTREAMKFYDLYEKLKKERNLFDYDDILESLNTMVEESDEVRDSLRENYLYVLIDEHQDSSGVQNEFLERVWKGEEKPNIFVVGDDRQLIYGFGGASLEYFENFKSTFGEAKLITLTENYRSTSNILDSAHELLESTLVAGKLSSNHKENYPLRLVEAYFPRDEVIACGLEIKNKISEGVDPNEMAILVPKNRQVASTTLILKDLGIPVARGENMNFFETNEAQMFVAVLRIILNPGDSVAFANSFFNTLSGVPPLRAHSFIKSQNMRNFSLLDVEVEKNNLFETENEVNAWVTKLKSWLVYSTLPLYELVQKVGQEFLLDGAANHEDLVLRIEVVRTLLHLVLSQIEKDKNTTLKDFIDFIDRVEAYGEDIPLAIFAPNEGVKVLTLHGSKGLEFEFVWIAHMDARSFEGGKVGGFSLPESISEKVSERDAEVLKRQLYVAITRAKKYCTVSYAQKSYAGASQELAATVQDIDSQFVKQSAEETEKFILSSDERAYVEKVEVPLEHTDIPKLIKLVAHDYADRKVSVSLLNNFFECPWKWYFRNLLQLPEPKSESLEFGNKIHSAIDKILKLKNAPTDDVVNAFVDGDKEAYHVVTNWVARRFDDIAKHHENEQSVSVSDSAFPGLSIYGKIDLIEHVAPDDVRVTDFKTGGVRKSSEIEKLDEEGRLSSYLRQLAMYSYLITHNNKWKVSVGESRLEFVESKNAKEYFYNTVVTDEQIQMIRKDIGDYDELVKSGAWVGRECHYNSYGKNTVCEYCKLAEIYKIKNIKA